MLANYRLAPLVACKAPFRDSFIPTTSNVNEATHTHDLLFPATTHAQPHLRPLVSLDPALYRPSSSSILLTTRSTRRPSRPGTSRPHPYLHLIRPGAPPVQPVTSHPHPHPCPYPSASSPRPLIKHRNAPHPSTTHVLNVSRVPPQLHGDHDGPSYDPGPTRPVRGPLLSGPSSKTTQARS